MGVNFQVMSEGGFDDDESEGVYLNEIIDELFSSGAAARGNGRARGNGAGNPSASTTSRRRSVPSSPAAPPAATAGRSVLLTSLSYCY